MKKNLFVYFSICTLFIVFCAVLATAKVQKITCLRSNQSCDPSYAALLDSLKGSSFFFSDSRALLLETHAGVIPFSIISIQKDLPNHYIITIQDEPALYTIYQDQTQTVSHAVSENGSYVTLQPEVTIPSVKIHSVDTLGIQEQPTAEFHSTIKTIIQNTSKAYKLESIEYRSPTEIILHYTNLPPFIITEAVPVYALQHIEKIMYTVENQQTQQPIKEVDLRFRLPVLRTET